MEVPSSDAVLPASQRLPTELVLHIFDWLVESDDPDAVTSPELLKLCRLSKAHQERFEARIYVNVHITSPRKLRQLVWALETRPVRGLYVRHLAILPYTFPDGAEISAGDKTLLNASQSKLLGYMPNATRALLSRAAWADWTPNLARLARLETAYLHGCQSYGDLAGLVQSQDDLLQQVVKDTSDRERSREMLRVTHASRLPLKRIELCLYSGAVLSELAQLTSLTHIALSNVWPRAQSMPGLPSVRLIPRSTMSHLLSSKTLEQVVLQDEPRVLERIASELGDIHDKRLVFRVVMSRTKINQVGMTLAQMQPALPTSAFIAEWAQRSEIWSRTSMVLSGDKYKETVRRHEAGLDIPDIGLIEQHVGVPFIPLQTDLIGCTAATRAALLQLKVALTPRSDLQAPLQLEFPGW